MDNKGGRRVVQVRGVLNTVPKEAERLRTFSANPISEISWVRRVS